MTTPINMALYRLLIKGGASEAEAEAAARLDTSSLATKADLFELESRLQRFTIQVLLGMTALFAGIVGLFRVFA